MMFRFARDGDLFLAVGGLQCSLEELDGNRVGNNRLDDALAVLILHEVVVSSTTSISRKRGSHLAEFSLAELGISFGSRALHQPRHLAPRFSEEIRSLRQRLFRIRPCRLKGRCIILKAKRRRTPQILQRPEPLQESGFRLIRRFRRFFDCSKCRKRRRDAEHGARDVPLCDSVEFFAGEEVHLLCVGGAEK